MSEAGEQAVINETDNIDDQREDSSVVQPLAQDLVYARVMGPDSARSPAQTDECRNGKSI